MDRVTLRKTDGGEKTVSRSALFLLQSLDDRQIREVGYDPQSVRDAAEEQGRGTASAPENS